MTDEQTSNDVELVTLDSQPILFVRETVPVSKLGEAQGEMLGALRNYLRQQGVRPAGPTFVRYHSFGASESDLELGVPVAEPLAGEGRVVGGTLPGGPALTLWHLGPHDDRLGEAYRRLHAWPGEHGRTIAAPGWEVHCWIDAGKESGPEAWPAPADWRTLLVQPLADDERW